MTMKPSPLTIEEIARRGDEIYEQQISLEEKQAHKGKIVAIDVETGAYEIAEDELAAAHRLRDRCPDAEVWFVRAGHRFIHRFGFGPARIVG
jgi:3-methyladenine DNA glycosylase Mpg